MICKTGVLRTEEGGGGDAGVFVWWVYVCLLWGLLCRLLLSVVFVLFAFSSTAMLLLPPTGTCKMVCSACETRSVQEEVSFSCPP